MKTLTERDETYIMNRWIAAYWYTAGREDEGATVDCIAFANYAKEEARKYRTEEVWHLASVTDQYRNFLS